MGSTSYPSRRSHHLQGYDYSQAGAYFVTICTEGKVCLFGDIVDGHMCHSPAGEMVGKVWSDLPRFSNGMDLDAFIVMPNHVHGTVVLRGGGASLPEILHRFKSFTTHQYGNGVRQKGWKPYAGRLWQRDYYEHVIRSEQELEGIREYIVNNAMKWNMDPESVTK